MALQPYELLNATRINGIMQGLLDPRLLPQDRVWSQRIPSQMATDGEILARYVGTPLIADIIAEDTKAVVYSQGKFQLETTRIPKLKFGVRMNEQMLTVLQRLQVNPIPQDMGIFEGWENQTMRAVIDGVNARREYLLIAMLLDDLDYDRLGVKIVDLTWGMPSDLKVTPAVTWDTPLTATPLTDIQTIIRLARIRYGVNYNRVTMSTSAFQYMVATTEFQNQMRAFGWGAFPTGIPAAAIPLQSDANMKTLVERFFNGTVKIELYDARFWQQDINGLTSAYPYLPINKVIIDSTANDGNPAVMDWANTILMESVVSNLGAVNLSGRLPMQPGPIAYATVPPDLNSPSVTYWGAMRGFPRKKMLQANAVLTVGTFTDTISTAIPFPV